MSSTEVFGSRPRAVGKPTGARLDGDLDRPIVYIVDDDPGVRSALKESLRGDGWVLRDFSSGEEFLESYHPDSVCCIVLDLQMPGLGGLEVQRELVERKALNPIICITGYADVPSAVQATRDGAVEFIEKPFSGPEIREAIARAIEKSAGLQKDRARRRRIQARLHLLTERESQILGMVVDGMLSREIAEELHLSRRTVEVHRNRLMKKMKAESVVELVRLVLGARE